MSARTLVLIIVGSLIGTLPGYAQLPTNNQTAPQTPSDMVRLLTDHGAVVQLPVKGKVKHSMNKGEPTFAMPQGASTVLLLQLPEYQAPYAMTITSYRRGVGRTKEIFVPRGLYFDAAFQQIGEFGEDRLAGRVESLAAELAIGEANRNARYLLLYTRGDMLGQRMGVRGDLGLVNSGLFRLERSLEAKLQVETRPERRSK